MTAHFFLLDIKIRFSYIQSILRQFIITYNHILVRTNPVEDVNPGERLIGMEYGTMKACDISILDETAVQSFGFNPDKTENHWIKGGDLIR